MILPYYYLRSPRENHAARPRFHPVDLAHKGMAQLEVDLEASSGEVPICPCKLPGARTQLQPANYDSLYAYLELRR